MQVLDFGPQGVTVRYLYYVGLLGDKPLVQPDFVAGYTGSFDHRLVPLSDEDYDQLIEMVAAYLLAYPELGSDPVNQLIEKIKPRLAA